MECFEKLTPGAGTYMFSYGSLFRPVSLALIMFLSIRSAAIAEDELPLLGSSAAPVVILEFSDYQCPYCQRFYETTFPQLKQTYIDSGIIAYSVRDNPLPIHLLARPAAHSAHCAQEQGRYWDFRFELLKSGDRIERLVFDNLAQRLSLDTSAFSACMESGKYFGQVDRDAKIAEAAGITGRPTFLIARRNDDIFSGERIVGAQPYSEFSTIIELLRKKRN